MCETHILNLVYSYGTPNEQSKINVLDWISFDQLPDLDIFYNANPELDDPGHQNDYHYNHYNSDWLNAFIILTGIQVQK